LSAKGSFLSYLEQPTFIIEERNSTYGDAFQQKVGLFLRTASLTATHFVLVVYSQEF